MKDKIIGYLKNYRFWILLIVLILTFLLVYTPHYNYDFALHADEWHHIEEARNLLNGNYDFSSVSAFEIGYHSFLAILSGVGFNLVLVYKLLPAIFAVLSSLALFFLVFYTTKSYFSSLFSIIFFASLPSNVNLLGLWFAIPLTISISLVYFSFLFLSRGIEQNNKRYLWIFVTLFFILTIIHAISAFFVFIISFLYLLLCYKRGKISKDKLKTLLFIPLILILVTITFIFLSGKNTGWFLSQLMFQDKWSPLNLGVNTNPITFSLSGVNILVSQYFLPLLFGTISFILVIIGLYLSVKKENLNLFAIWFFYCIFMEFLFVTFNISPFVSYQRILYYSLMVLCPLAGIGLVEAIRFIKIKLPQKRIATLLFILVLIFIVFFFAFYNYGHQRAGTELYYLINSQDYENIILLGKSLNNKLILAPIEVSTVIPAITNNRVLSTIYFTGNDQIREDIKQFFFSNCSVKQEIASQYGVDYVYSLESIDCLSFKERYSGKFFLYLFNNQV